MNVSEIEFDMDLFDLGCQNIFGEVIDNVSSLDFLDEPAMRNTFYEPKSNVAEIKYET